MFLVLIVCGVGIVIGVVGLRYLVIEGINIEVYVEGLII